MECFICKKDKKSTEYRSDWEQDVCSECDKILEDGYNECYPESTLEKIITVATGARQPGEGYGNCDCGTEGCCQCNPW